MLVALIFAAMLAILPMAVAAQAPDLSIELSPSVSVHENTAITATMNFSNLEFDSNTADTDYVFRADVVGADVCEGSGIGIDRYMYKVDQNPEVRTGTISAVCPVGSYVLNATISSSDNVLIAQSVVEFSVGPSIAIGLSSGYVPENTSITATMNFSNLEFDSNTADTDYVFRADVVGADVCEGSGIGIDRYMYKVDQNPEVRTGTISADCPEGNYTLEVSVSSPENVELASASANFFVGVQKLPRNLFASERQPREDNKLYAYRMSPTPTVSISGGRPAVVTEGMAVNFTVHLDEAPTSDMNVFVRLDDGDASLLGNSTPLRIISLDANTMSKEFTVETDDDSVWEEHGNITVVVEEAGFIDSTYGYYVSESDGSAMVTVNDNDFPDAEAVLTVSPVDVSKGGNVTVEVSVTTDRDEMPHRKAGIISLSTTPITAQSGDYTPLSENIDLGDFSYQDIGGGVMRYKATSSPYTIRINNQDRTTDGTFSVKIERNPTLARGIRFSGTPQNVTIYANVDNYKNNLSSNDRNSLCQTQSRPGFCAPGETPVCNVGENDAYNSSIPDARRYFESWGCVLNKPWPAPEPGPAPTCEGSANPANPGEICRCELGDNLASDAVHDKAVSWACHLRSVTLPHSLNLSVANGQMNVSATRSDILYDDLDYGTPRSWSWYLLHYQNVDCDDLRGGEALNGYVRAVNRSAGGPGEVMPISWDIAPKRSSGEKQAVLVKLRVEYYGSRSAVPATACVTVPYS